MIQNPDHVRGMRDAIHAGVQDFAEAKGLGLGSIHGNDLAAALAFVMRDLIRQAPDSTVRHQLLAEIKAVLDDAAAGSLILRPH